MERTGCVCPLLRSPDCYKPDTVDLTTNAKARDYWLPCLEQMVQKFVGKASSLNPNNPHATDDAQKCFYVFHKLVEDLKLDPNLMKPLSIRTLLEFNERTFKENNLQDAWAYLKEKETLTAFQEFKERVSYLDSIQDFYSRLLEVAKGILAGNIFDWGAKAVTDMMEQSNFGFIEAVNTIQKRPWFQDDLDNWIKRLEDKPYRKAVVFVDNAGVDFVLGVLPLVRELLRQNTCVVIAANTSPALNDVTQKEAHKCLRQAAQCCPVIREALAAEKIVAVENGQCGPCLDLSDLTAELCDKMRHADLILLEGMGRAVHTNLNAQFNVDSLKLAVLKNEWLAKSLGAEQFSVIFEYRAAA